MFPCILLSYEEANTILRQFMLDEVISIMIYNRKLKHKHFLYSIHYYHFKMQDFKSGTMHVYYQYIFIPSHSQSNFISLAARLNSLYWNHNPSITPDILKIKSLIESLYIYGTQIRIKKFLSIQIQQLGTRLSLPSPHPTTPLN